MPFLPILAVVGLAVLVLVTQNRGRAKSGGGLTPPPPLAVPQVPHSLQTALGAMQEKKATADQLKEAAQEAVKMGWHDTAEILAAEHIEMSEIEREEQSRFPKNALSPIVGVSNAQWQTFVKRMKNGRMASISPAFKLGFFHIGMRRLEDLGWAKDVHRGEWKGRSVWVGEFVDADLETFLRNPRFQYDVFESSMKDYAFKAKNRYANAIGREIDLGDNKAIVTWSGLLGLAHQAGLKAVDSWLKNPEDREKFPNTTRIFARVTGIF